jgi:hypothetical protein
MNQNRNGYLDGCVVQNQCETVIRLSAYPLLNLKGIQKRCSRPNITYLSTTMRMSSSQNVKIVILLNTIINPEILGTTT